VRFLLVDRILAMTPGRDIVATRRVPPDEEYFQDHFPGFPVVPGVLLTEMMGQAAAKCLNAERRPRGNAMLAKIQSASFRQWVRPGDDVVLHATIESNEERFATAECRAEVGNRPVAQARLLFAFMPLDRFAPGLRDEVLERFLSQGAS
jgi:3-hydroxyacyl-[acyl-carrier-protein] dehydratase